MSLPESKRSAAEPQPEAWHGHPGHEHHGQDARATSRVGAPLVGALSEDRHEACPYVVIELRKVQGDGLPPACFRIHHAARRVGQARHLVMAFTRSNGA